MQVYRPACAGSHALLSWRGVRPNRRPGMCLDCHEPVAPGAGSIRRTGPREWGAVHNDGDHPVPPPTSIGLPQRFTPGRPNRFTTPCAGCGDTVPVGKGTEKENVIMCSDCTYGAA